MEEDEEEKRSDTPERNDKDDLDKKDVTTNSKEEQNPEEKEEDTAEVEGAHVEVKPCKGSRAEKERLYCSFPLLIHYLDSKGP